MANTKDDKKEISPKDISAVQKTNNIFTKFFDNISNSVISSDSKRAREIEKINQEIDMAVNDEYNTMTRFSSGDFTAFVNKLLSEQDPSGNPTTLDKAITDDSNSFGAFFHERFKNINNKYEDLKLITEYLFELQAAVTTMRDNIVSSDDISVNISREIKFENVTDKSKKDSYMNIVTGIEKKYKLEKYIRNIIIPNTLVYGNFYGYTIPYAKVFSKFDTKNGSNSRVLKETYLAGFDTDKNNKNTEVTLEQFEVTVIKESFKECGADITNDNIRSGLNDIFSRIEVLNESTDFPLLEDASISSLSDPDLLKMVADKKRVKTKTTDVLPPDGIVNTNSDILPEYKDVKGVYVKLLSPLRVIPVYILDECVGYYILYENFTEMRNNIVSNGQTNRTNLLFQQLKKKDGENAVVDVIAKRIVKKIDKKFIENNVKFRDLIVNALMYDDLYKKDFKVQFVSAEYMTHFKVNEDIDTHEGESMIAKSLFYAKMYLLLLVFKMISVVTKSNDTRVMYMRQSGMEKNLVNNIQNAARQYKDNTISFNDMSSVNTFLSKAGKSKDMFVGIGTTGEKAIDFDILAGQDVPMNTDFMEFLRKNMINGTDVPSVIMEYIDSADFAKSIVMANNKYTTKILSVQKELSPSMTEFYQKLLKYDAQLDDTIIECLTYEFCRPKSLNIQNSADIISNAEQTATFLIKTICGDSDRYDDKTKDKIFNMIVTEILLPGLFDWETITNKITTLLSDKKVDDMADDITKKEENPA